MVQQLLRESPTLEVSSVPFQRFLNSADTWVCVVTSLYYMSLAAMIATSNGGFLIKLVPT